MIFEFIIAFIIYFAIVPTAYYVTEVKRLPQWLQFPPFDCRKCLTFWSNIVASIVIGLSFNLYITMATVLVMGVLTAIAMHVDQKRKTIKIDNDIDINDNTITVTPKSRVVEGYEILIEDGKIIKI